MVIIIVELQLICWFVNMSHFCNKKAKKGCQNINKLKKKMKAKFQLMNLYTVAYLF